jgi:acyl dehydratase
MDTQIDNDVDLEAALQRCVRDARGTRAEGRYPVNEAMIDMWADALGDRNPVYVDVAAARATGRAGVIAPPTMLQAWLMPPLSTMAGGMRDVPGYAPYWTDAPRAAADGEPDPGLGAYALLSDHGFSANAATNCRQTYRRELRPGDRISAVTTLDSISARKQTAMGAGHFVTTRMEFADQDGDPVATQLWTILRFRPPDEPGGAGPAPEPPAAPFRQVSAGDAVPADVPADRLEGAARVGQRTGETVIPITPTFVIATAIATHDFYAIHHDVDWARSIGRPDIFTNILTTTGLVGRVLSDWAGPHVRIRSIDLRLLVPNYPGDVLRLAGEVTAVDGSAVTLSVVGRNGLGDHVRATVVGQL